MTAKKIQLAVLLLITVLLCSGCWDKKEYNQLALAQAIAIDYTDGQYQLTMQLIMPKASEETVSSENIWIIDGQGDSVGDALEQIALRAPREIYLDHLDIVLLGEALMQWAGVFDEAECFAPPDQSAGSRGNGRRYSAGEAGSGGG